jgi:capsular polysaccharide biosynthesis protein
VTDPNQTVRFSLNGNGGPPERLEAFDYFDGAPDQPATLASGLVSLGFIKAGLRRAARFWCLLAVVGLVIGAGINVKFPPAIKASTSVLITYGPDENPTSAVLDNQAIAQSRTVAQLAMSKLGLQQSLGSFAATITASVVTDRVLQITVSAPTGAEAVSRANAVAAAFLQFRANQMETGQRLLLQSLQQEVDQARQNLDSINAQISQLSAQSATSARQSQLKNLRTQLAQANGQLAVDQQTYEGEKVSTAVLSAVTGSVVLDPAVPIVHSRLKYLVIYALIGLVGGLGLGLSLVVVRTVVSDRLRRRDDVTHALGAPVKLSVGPVRLSRWRPGRHGLAAANGTDVRRIVAYLRGAVPSVAAGPTALAVVPVDDPEVAALSLVSLAVSRAQEGRTVVVADLASGAPAATLLHSRKPGVRSVNVRDAHLIIAVPDPDDIAPIGPLGRAPSDAQDDEFTATVRNACASADLLLTLATLDPSLGGDHLATWATRAVAVVTSGRSSWARIHAVGEMIRLAGTSLPSAVLVGADKTDDSVGVPESSGALVGPGDLGLGITNR